MLTITRRWSDAAPQVVPVVSQLPLQPGPPSHCSGSHTMPLPQVSDSVQLLSQPSQSARLLSSHASPGPWTPLPQVVSGSVVVVVVGGSVVVVVVGAPGHTPAVVCSFHFACWIVFGVGGVVKSMQ